MQVYDTGGVQSVSKGRAPGEGGSNLYNLWTCEMCELYMLLEL